MDPESKKLDGVTEEFLHLFDKKSYLKTSGSGTKEKAENFDFKSETTDLDDLADEIFDALHDHTHKYLYEE